MYKKNTNCTNPLSSVSHHDFPPQTPKRPNFLRRTKATSPPDVTDTDTIDTIETTTSRFRRRGGSKFKSRKEIESAKNAGNEIERRRPSLNGGAARSERPVRNFVRRRLGGANGESGFYICVLSLNVASIFLRDYNHEDSSEYRTAGYSHAEACVENYIVMATGGLFFRISYQNGKNSCPSVAVLFDSILNMKNF